MCDYSLQYVANRPAKVGDKLVSTQFVNSITRGFAAVGEPNVAVCLLPGTELVYLVPFIAYTGVRSEEARSARWAQIDLDQGVWTITDTKEGKAHLVWLSTGARRVLAGLKREGSFLFSAPTREGFMDPPQKAVETVRGRSGVRDFRLHDLRRTVRTRLPGLGVSPDVAERVLGHALPGMRKVYDQYDYLPQTRRALEAWSAELDRILAACDQGRADILAFGRN